MISVVTFLRDNDWIMFEILKDEDIEWIISAPQKLYLPRLPDNSKFVYLKEFDYDNLANRTRNPIIATINSNLKLRLSFDQIVSIFIENENIKTITSKPFLIYCKKTNCFFETCDDLSAEFKVENTIAKGDDVHYCTPYNFGYLVVKNYRFYDCKPVYVDL